MTICTRTVCTPGIRLGKHLYFSPSMMSRQGERAEIDDLDVSDPEEVAVRFEDGVICYAGRVGHDPSKRKGPFERALRHRTPFQVPAPTGQQGIDAGEPEAPKGAVPVQNLTTEELGAILRVCGQLMQYEGLSIGAALDGSDADYFSAELEQLAIEPERAQELASISYEQLLLALEGV